MDKLPKIYFIPGLGTDRRLFDKLRKAGLEFEVIEFIRPRKRENISDYACRLSEKMDTSRPFILGGVSFGGILASEISEITNPELVIFLSTVKNADEFPFYLKSFRYFPLHRLIPLKPFTKLGRKYFILKKGEDKTLMREMLVDSDPVFMNWAVNAAITWRKKNTPAKYLHIHGTHDRLFPFRFIKNAREIKGATHGMVLGQAGEVFEKIQNFLQEYQVANDGEFNAVLKQSK